MTRTSKKSARIQNAAIETLEGRTMFSVFTTSVYDGNLKVTGTPGRDDLTINVTNQVTHTKTMGDVTYTYTTQDVNLSTGKARKVFHDIRFVSVDLKGQDDKVTLHGLGLSDYSTMVYIDLGPGNDKAIIQNYDGAVQVDGGPGNDNISSTAAIPIDYFLGMASYRSLNGGEGDDTIRGSNADDGLSGGPGNDLLYGNAGDDFLMGGTGTNKLYGSPGNDFFSVYPVDGLYPDSPWSLGGNDQIDGGEGDDKVLMESNSQFNAKPVFGLKAILNVETTQVYDYASDGGGKG